MNARVLSRVVGKYRSLASRWLYRRPLRLRATVPHISFTFDDFPASALSNGGAVLARNGVRGTYYVSLGLAGRDEPPGRMFVAEDLAALIAGGHELGCHTFDHRDAWDTAPEAFESSILHNREALQRLAPGAAFESFSYPISGPRPGSKRRAGRHFACCRCGGQSFNAGVVDLNLLKAFFLEKSGGDLSAVRRVIEANARARGWLIFATHDVQADPSPYGCTVEFFEGVVRCAVESGATVLPVGRALAALVSP